MRLMRLGRLLSFMSSRARVLPPSSLTAAIESLPAAPEAVGTLRSVRAALDDDDGVDADEQLAAAAAAAATALERAAHRHGKRGWTTLRDIDDHCRQLEKPTVPMIFTFVVVQDRPNEFIFILLYLIVLAEHVI